MHLIRHIHYVNHNKPDSKNFSILNRASKLVLVVAKIFTWLCVFIGLVIILSPVPKYILSGELSEMFPLYVPIFDETTRYGYVGSIIFQFFYIGLGALGIACSDLLFIVPVLYLLPLVDIFRTRFDELNHLLWLGETARNSEMVYMCLRNIIQMHQEICQ